MSMMLESSESFEGDTWEDYLGDGEDFDGEYDHGEAYDEASRTTRRRRQRAQRARQLELARRRRTQSGAAMQRRPMPGARAAAAINTLQLENRVQDDAFRAALAAQEKRQGRAEFAAVAAVVAKQLQDSFQGSVSLLQNPFAKAALTASPLLFLPSSRKGDGVGSYLSDKRVIGAAAVFGLAFIGEQQDRADEAADIRLIGASEVTEGDETIILADVVDRKGRILQGKNVLFSVDRPDLVDIDANGRVSTKTGTGLVVVEVKVDNVIRRTVLSVKARPAQQQAATAKAA